MKRDKTERDTDYHQQFDSLTKANSLMLLSREATDHKEIEDDSNIMTSNSNSSPSSQSRVFECKTCNRQFTSFQALGGHRASHKKPRLMGSENQYSQGSDPVTKHKTHECTICGLEFSIGQALGGHMRRHRASSMNQKFFRSFNGSNSQVVVPVSKKSDHKSRRVLFLDLNLTPLENDTKILQLGMEQFPIIS